jgi:uncharacterized membrane protein HdeD (DUF308 family)
MLSGQTSLGMVDMNTLRVRFERELRTHKGKYIFQGTIFIILGILAAALPAATALSVELMVGVVLLFSGVFQLVLTIKSKMHWWSILSALFSVAVGAVMIWKPMAGLLALVTLIAIFMTIEGIFELLLAWQFRPVRNWGWMLFSGIVTLVLAVILWIGFPAFDVLYLGWVIAINLILYGLSLMMLVWRVVS